MTQQASPEPLAPTEAETVDPSSNGHVPSESERRMQVLMSGLQQAVAPLIEAFASGKMKWLLGDDGSSYVSGHIDCPACASTVLNLRGPLSALQMHLEQEHQTWPSAVDREVGNVATATQKLARALPGVDKPSRPTTTLESLIERAVELQVELFRTDTPPERALAAAGELNDVAQQLADVVSSIQTEAANAASKAQDAIQNTQQAG